MYAKPGARHRSKDAATSGKVQLKSSTMDCGSGEGNYAACAGSEAGWFSAGLQ